MTSKSHSLLCAQAHITQVRNEPSTRAAVRDLQQQGEPGLHSAMAALLVLRLQLRLGWGKRNAVQRLRVSTVISAPPAAVLRQLVNAASMPRWDAAVMRARCVLSLNANSNTATRPHEAGARETRAAAATMRALAQGRAERAI